MKTKYEKLTELAGIFPILSGAYSESTDGVDGDILLDAIHDYFFQNLHPDDRSVVAFADKMSAKLKFAREVKGRGGWQDKSQCTEQYLSGLLRGHVEKGDPVDVANLAMMLSMRGESIKPLVLGAMEVERILDSDPFRVMKRGLAIRALRAAITAIHPDAQLVVVNDTSEEIDL